eukprot:7247783-Pyramimonas_sp.AAC.1
MQGKVHCVSEPGTYPHTVTVYPHIGTVYPHTITVYPHTVTIYPECPTVDESRRLCYRRTACSNAFEFSPPAIGSRAEYIPPPLLGL